MFSKDLYSRHVKNQGLFGKGSALSQATKSGLDFSKLKLDVDENVSATIIMEFFLEGTENTAGKEDMQITGIFCFSLQCFPKASSK